MTADTGQKITRSTDVIGNIETGNGAGGGFAFGLPNANRDGRTMIFFHQASGNQADNSLVIGSIGDNNQGGKIVFVYQSLGVSESGDGQILAGAVSVV